MKWIYTVFLYCLWWTLTAERFCIVSIAVGTLLGMHYIHLWVDKADYMQMRLSETASVAIKMPLKGRSGQPVEAVLTQQEFEGLSADLFRRARLPLDEACWQV